MQLGPDSWARLPQLPTFGPIFAISSSKMFTSVLHLLGHFRENGSCNAVPEATLQSKLSSEVF